MTRKFNYDSLSVGYYDEIFKSGPGIRRAWHVQKFHRIRDCLPKREGQSILDIGCFSGTFLSTLPEDSFSRQVGADIIEQQIAYATGHYGTPFRKFVHFNDPAELLKLGPPFDIVTLIEVIEHLKPAQITDLLGVVAKILKPGGRLVLSTPNYLSIWPLLEFYLNRFSDVSYEEQHITKFTYYGFLRQLEHIYPGLKDEFRLDMKTTTHFITPFLAGLSFSMAERLSAMFPHNHWKLPFGCLLLAVFVRQ